MGMMVDKEKLMKWVERLRVESNQRGEYDHAMAFSIVQAAVNAGEFDAEKTDETK